MADMDMAKLLSLFKDEDDAPKASGCGMCGGDHGLDEDCNMEEGWDNEPDEEIEAYEPNKFAGGINRPKKAQKVKNPGDPIREQEELESRIKAELTALYKL